MKWLLITLFKVIIQKTTNLEGTIDGWCRERGDNFYRFVFKKLDRNTSMFLPLMCGMSFLPTRGDMKKDGCGFCKLAETFLVTWLAYLATSSTVALSTILGMGKNE